MPAIAYAMTTFVLVPKMQKALRSPATAPTEAGKEARAETANAGKEGSAPGGAGQSVTLNKVLVNVAGTMGSRYLLSSITLLGDASDFPARVSQHEPQLRDMASGILNTKTIADLEKPGARNLIRGELLAGFNTIMGSAAVREIYFTEFAIQ
jgi:flagellar protein FliL